MLRTAPANVLFFGFFSCLGAPRLAATTTSSATLVCACVMPTRCKTCCSAAQQVKVLLVRHQHQRMLLLGSWWTLLHLESYRDALRRCCPKWRTPSHRQASVQHLLCTAVLCCLPQTCSAAVVSNTKSPGAMQIASQACLHKHVPSARVIWAIL